MTFHALHALQTMHAMPGINLQASPGLSRVLSCPIELSTRSAIIECQAECVCGGGPYCTAVLFPLINVLTTCLFYLRCSWLPICPSRSPSTSLPAIPHCPTPLRLVLAVLVYKAALHRKIQKQQQPWIASEASETSGS